MAKALDIVGDRWSLLIVRELLALGPCRYTDLRNGLPGVATNLLADRLRELERAGIIRTEEAPPPIATTLFHLTTRGQELEPVVLALGRWGGPLLAGARRKDVFLTHWLSLPAKLHLRDRTPSRPPVTIEIRTGDQPMIIETADGSIRARAGSAPDPDAILSGTPPLIVGVLSGRLTLSQARADGLKYDGNLQALRRVLPNS